MVVQREGAEMPEIIYETEFYDAEAAEETAMLSRECEICYIECICPGARR